MQSFPSNDKIVIGLTGDVMIGRLVNHYLDAVDPSFIWGNLLPILKRTDMNLINLETALTTSKKKVPKVFNFKADPAKVRSLCDASVHVANLANNHVLDYNQEGLFETLSTLDRVGIKHVGAGKNLEEASAPVIMNVCGMNIGILGCTDNEPTWCATETTPGIRYLDIRDFEEIKKDIQTLRSKVDVLILSIHWGPNMKQRPSHEFTKFAHQAIENGVDLLHGHSAHIFQGVEIYKGKLILYDTGDFIDDYAVDPFLRNDWSFLFLVELSRSGIQQLRCIPAVIDNCQVNKAVGKEAKEIIKRMKNLSREWNTSFQDSDDDLNIWLNT